MVNQVKAEPGTVPHMASAGPLSSAPPPCSSSMTMSTSITTNSRVPRGQTGGANSSSMDPV